MEMKYFLFGVGFITHSLGVYVSSRVESKKRELALYYHIFPHYMHCIMHNADGPNATQPKRKKNCVAK